MVASRGFDPPAACGGRGTRAGRRPPALRRTPTTYYGVHSGAGLVLGSPQTANRRVAIVGLGAGTLAAYGRTGDLFRFYEIDPAVIRAARESFDFLRDSTAETSVVAGDGRLAGRDDRKAGDSLPPARREAQDQSAWCLVPSRVPVFPLGTRH